MNWKFWERTIQPTPPVRDMRKAQRAYAAAMIDRLTSGWVTQSTSTDSELRGSLVKVRDRSRGLGRDNEYAVNFFRLVQNNVVGSGVRLQAQVKMIRGGKLDDGTNNKIEAAWDKWKRKENCHTAGKLAFEDIERLAIRAVAESGEVLIRMITQKMGNTKTPLALEVIESDLLVESYFGMSNEGNEIRMGVEINGWGRPVNYFFYPKHPGDFSTNSVAANVGRYVKIPASEILHLFVTHRPSQTRGAPWLAPVIMRMHQMQGYEEAEVIAARASSAIMGFIQTPEGEITPDDIVDGDSITDFQPGVFKTLGPGETVNIPQMNRPGGNYDPFIRSNVRAIASGLGISFESLSKDYSQATYSSARQALLEDRDNWRTIQAWMIENFHQPIFEKWLDLAVLSGEISLKGFEQNPEPFYGVKWMPRGWNWIDPTKEVQAFKEAVRCGFTTQTAVISQNGEDIEELMAQRHREVEMAKDFDLEFDTNTASANAMGTAQIGATTGGPNETQPPADNPVHPVKPAQPAKPGNA